MKFEFHDDIQLLELVIIIIFIIIFLIDTL